MSAAGLEARSEASRVDLRGLPRARVICTLGMHRSGTSLVSRTLNLLGVQLGSDERLLTGNEHNLKGYWEHRSFVDLNDEILNRFGGRWNEPPAFPPSWPRDARVGDLREKARDLLTEDFATQRLWGWKDPRTCLTLPFWQDVIGPMRYVMCVRNPCAVVASLTRRDEMSSKDAERLWLAHVQASLAHTNGQPRLFVFYEDIINDWRPELRRMAAFVGDPQRGVDPDVQQSVAEFLEDELCHHSMSIEDLACDQRLSFATKSLYLSVREHALRNTPIEGAFGLDRTGRSVHKMLKPVESLTFETSSRTAAAGAERDTLAREHQVQAAIIAVLNIERNRLAAEASILGEKALALSADCEEGEAARQTLQEIHGSCAWRLVTFSRGVIVAVLPAGTRRRRVFHAVLRRIVLGMRSPRAQRAASIFASTESPIP